MLLEQSLRLDPAQAAAARTALAQASECQELRVGGEWAERVAATPTTVVAEHNARPAADAWTLRGDRLIRLSSAVEGWAGDTSLPQDGQWLAGVLEKAADRAG